MKAVYRCDYCGKYMSQCTKWEKEEVSYDPDAPFAKMLHNMWGI